MKNNLPYSVLREYNSWDNVPRAAAVGAAIMGNVGTASIFGSTFLGGALAFITPQYIVGYLVTSLVTSWAMKALAPKSSSRSSSSVGLLVNAREPAASQDFVYGEVRKGGVITFYESSGDDNTYLHQIIALAGHEVHSVDDIYINDQVATFSGNFVTTAGSGDSEVDWDSKIRIKKYDGSQTTADSDLVSETSATSTFVGNGIAYLYVRYEYDQDVFANGLPLITAKIRGKKVYDPRTASTAYSNNAALCIRDFLTSSYGLSDNSIDDVDLAAAANECDENVALDGGGTEKRYTANGVIRASTPTGSVLEDLVTSCAGTLFWGGGKWKLKAGAYTSPVKTLTLDDLRGPINLSTRVSMRDNFNTVRGVFNDAAQDYITADYPEIKSTAFINQDDGEEVALDLELPFTTSAASAQRLAKLTLFRGREQMTLSADFGLEAMEIEVGDIIAFTNARYGFSAKEFEVVGWKLSASEDAGDLRINLTLRETSQAAFDWNAEETAIISNDSNLPNPYAGLTITNLSVTDKGNVQNDGTFVGQALVSWTKATSSFISHYEVQWKDVNETSYLRSEIPASDSSVVISPLETGTQYNIRVRPVTVSQINGTWVAATPYTHGGDTIAPSPVSGLSAVGGPKSAVLDWTAPTTQVGGGTLYDLKGYYIYRNTSNSQPVDPIAFSGSDKYIDGGLGVASTYYYWVTAVDFTGNESTAVASGAVTTDSAVISQDTRVYTGRVYYGTLQSATPSTPSATSFNEANQTFGGLTSGWSLSQPVVTITDTTVKEWSSKYKVVFDIDDNATITFTTPDGAFQVTDDIESDNYVSGTSGWRIERDTGNAEFQNAIVRGTLNASDITAGTLSVNRLPGLTTKSFDTLLLSNSGVAYNLSDSMTLTSVPSGAFLYAIIGGYKTPNGNPDQGVSLTDVTATLSCGGSVSQFITKKPASDTNEKLAVAGVLALGSTSNSTATLTVSVGTLQRQTVSLNCILLALQV